MIYNHICVNYTLHINWLARLHIVCNLV